MSTLEGAIHLEEELKGDVLIVHFKGKLDAISTPSAEKRIFDYINQGKYKLLFDFAGLQYMSSAGMRMLLSTTKKLKSLSGILIVASVPKNILDELKMSG